jgi:hypothetical protein
MDHAEPRKFRLLANDDEGSPNEHHPRGIVPNP